MGRNKFSEREINTIRKMLARKMSGTRFQQKMVRHELRTKFEFNISDFGKQGEAFGPEQLDESIERGHIQILDEETIKAMKFKRARLRMTFRPATENDSYFIAHGFHMAMHYKRSEEEIARFAELICTRDDVLYCAGNTLIAEYNGEMAGMLTAYDGRYYHEMRERTMKLIKEYFDTEFPDMEDEAVEGEYYLDSLAVWPQYRGIGLGTALLERGIAEGLRLGLNVTLTVDPKNKNAQSLYASLGFERDGELFIFGKNYWKMTYHNS
jgi:ribosomal protein S18 acetylase RimI-like enzyme